MSGQERAPSFGRLCPLGCPIVQILIDIRCGDWVDCGNAHFPLCGCEGLVENNVNVIKPSELGDLHEAQRRVGIDDRERQHQNERVFPDSTHAAPFAPPRQPKNLHVSGRTVNSHLAQMVPAIRTLVLASVCVVHPDHLSGEHPRPGFARRQSAGLAMSPPRSGSDD